MGPRLTPVLPPVFLGMALSPDPCQLLARTQSGSASLLCVSSPQEATLWGCSFHPHPNTLCGRIHPTQMMSNRGQSDLGSLKGSPLSRNRFQKFTPDTQDLYFSLNAIYLKDNKILNLAKIRGLKCLELKCPDVYNLL